MNNKAHLRPNDYDRNGDIIPSGWKEEKGDLISREALKKALHNFFDGKVIDEPAYILRDVFCHIDSSTTVSVNPYYVAELESRNKELIKIIEDEVRPKGEWLVKDGLAECNKCHHLFSFFGNFCSNCGAEMFNGSEDQ